MDNMGKQIDYLANRKKTPHYKQILPFNCQQAEYTLEELSLVMESIKEEMAYKEQVKVICDCCPDTEDCGYDFALVVSWLDWETMEEYQKRQTEERVTKQRALGSLKYLVSKYPKDAMEMLRDVYLS